MTRLVAIFRPEPGNQASCALAQSLGLTTLSLPLFEVGPLAWKPPDPAAHDALVLTSANALRWGGTGLATLKSLPVFAVGAATAAAAAAQGFSVMATGQSDADALLALANAAGVKQALHLGGRETTVDCGGIISKSIAVYASNARPVPTASLAKIAGAVAALHSARAARRLAAMIDEGGVPRADVTIAALSPAVAAAAGTGWEAVITADAPDDGALLAQIARLPGATD